MVLENHTQFILRHFLYKCNSLAWRWVEKKEEVVGVGGGGGGGGGLGGERSNQEHIM